MQDFIVRIANCVTIEMRQLLQTSNNLDGKFEWLPFPKYVADSTICIPIAWFNGVIADYICDWFYYPNGLDKLWIKPFTITIPVFVFVFVSVYPLHSPKKPQLNPFFWLHFQNKSIRWKQRWQSGITFYRAFISICIFKRYSLMNITKAIAMGKSSCFFASERCYLFILFLKV